MGRVTGREEQEPADAVFSCEERTLLVRMTVACACRRSSTALSDVLLRGIEMPKSNAFLTSVRRQQMQSMIDRLSGCGGNLPSCVLK